MGDRSKNYNMNIGAKIRLNRENLGLTQKELAAKVFKGESTVRMWELGQSEPDLQTIILLSKIFHITVNDLIEDDEKAIKQIGGYDLLSGETNLIPLVGQVVAGKPIESPEYLEGYVYVAYKNPDEYFALKVKGDSMINAGITERSILIVHKQNCAENGDIIIASIDGESTVKRYREDKGAVFLVPENPNYSPIFVSPESNFYIFGKVVQIRTDL